MTRYAPDFRAGLIHKKNVSVCFTDRIILAENIQTDKPMTVRQDVLLSPKKGV